MRRMLALIVVLVLAALPAAVLQAPTPTQAARDASPIEVIATLVSTSQMNPPATLLLQARTYTVRVQVTGKTEIINRDNWPITLADLQDRAQLRVVGNFTGSQIIARTIQNLSLTGTPNLDLKGQLTSGVPAVWQTGTPLCLSSSQITNLRRTNVRVPQVDYCGNRLAVYLTSGTRIEARGGRVIDRAMLRLGDTLQVTARLTDGRLVASLVRDTSITVNAITSTTLTGQVVATPSGPNGAGVSSLLLQVDGRTVLVQITGQTRLIDANSNPIALSNLQNQHRLRVTGAYNGTQLTASTVQDLSLPGVTTVQVTGQMAAPLPTVATGPLCISGAQVSSSQAPMIRAMVTTPCGSNLAVYLNGSTSIVDSNGQAVSLGALLLNDNLSVTATLNGGQLTASRVQDLTPAAPAKVQVTGQLAAPLPTLATGPLCISGAQVSSNQAPMIRAMVTTPCGSNLAVYLNGSTILQNSSGQPVALNALRVGDNLSASASLSSGQLTGILVQDLSF